MTDTVAATSTPIWWRAHDIAVGLLAGLGVGTIGGLFANRLVESNIVIAGCGIVGAVLAIYVLIQSHTRTRTFINGVVIVSWVLLGLSALFLAALIQAILNFE
ncbi:MAG: hypothetical protein WB245_07600 [Acidimicrobiia bacterium]